MVQLVGEKWDFPNEDFFNEVKCRTLNLLVIAKMV